METEDLAEIFRERLHQNWAREVGELLSPRLGENVWQFDVRPFLPLLWHLAIELRVRRDPLPYVWMTCSRAEIQIQFHSPKHIHVMFYQYGMNFTFYVQKNREEITYHGDLWHERHYTLRSAVKSLNGRRIEPVQRSRLTLILTTLTQLLDEFVAG